MSLACRFCHVGEEKNQQLQNCPYSVVLTHGSTTAVMNQVEKIEEMQKVIPGYCVHCEICGKYSMISHTMLPYIHGLYAAPMNSNALQNDPILHYAYLCNGVRNADSLEKLESERVGMKVIAECTGHFKGNARS